MNYELILKDIENIRNNKKIFYVIAFTMYFHSVMTNIAYYLHEQKESIPDLLFDLLPRYDKIGLLSDIFSVLYFFIFIIFIFHPYYIIRPYLTTDIFLTMIKTYIICIYLRCFSFIFTRLPSPSDQCKLNSKEYNPPTIHDIFSRFDMFNGCGDLIFSGHTTIIMIVSLTIIYYMKGIFTKKTEIKLNVFILLYTLFFLIVIIIARNHYTVDVVVAVYTCILCFYLVINDFKIKYKQFENIEEELQEVVIDEELPKWEVG